LLGNVLTVKLSLKCLDSLPPRLHLDLEVEEKGVGKQQLRTSSERSQHEIQVEQISFWREVGCHDTQEEKVSRFSLWSHSKA
jgi:hypothetical protein